MYKAHEDKLSVVKRKRTYSGWLGCDERQAHKS